MYQAVSLFLWGNEQEHYLLQELVYAELIEHALWYQSHTNRILAGFWDEILENRRTDEYSGMVHFFALCNALNIVDILYEQLNPLTGSVGTYFPFRPCMITDHRFHLNQLHIGTCSIAWYPFGKNINSDNHFVFVHKCKHTFLRALYRETNESLIPYQHLCQDMFIPNNVLEHVPRGRLSEKITINLCIFKLYF
jgi:hypothetical protein